MQDDPSTFRVPILKLSDILGEDGQDGTIEGTDTAVTGMSWHTIGSTQAAVVPARQSPAAVTAVTQPPPTNPPEPLRVETPPSYMQPGASAGTVPTLTRQAPPTNNAPTIQPVGQPLAVPPVVMQSIPPTAPYPAQPAVPPQPLYPPAPTPVAPAPQPIPQKPAAPPVAAPVAPTPVAQPATPTIPPAPVAPTPPPTSPPVIPIQTAPAAPTSPQPQQMPPAYVAAPLTQPPQAPPMSHEVVAVPISATPIPTPPQAAPATPPISTPPTAQTTAQQPGQRAWEARLPKKEAPKKKNLLDPFDMWERTSPVTPPTPLPQPTLADTDTLKNILSTEPPANLQVPTPSSTPLTPPPPYTTTTPHHEEIKTLPPIEQQPPLPPTKVESDLWNPLEAGKPDTTKPLMQHVADMIGVSSTQPVPNVTPNVPPPIARASSPAPSPTPVSANPPVPPAPPISPPVAARQEAAAPLNKASDAELGALLSSITPEDASLRTPTPPIAPTPSPQPVARPVPTAPAPIPSQTTARGSVAQPQPDRSLPTPLAPPTPRKVVQEKSTDTRVNAHVPAPGERVEVARTPATPPKRPEASTPPTRPPQKRVGIDINDMWAKKGDPVHTPHTEQSRVPQAAQAKPISIPQAPSGRSDARSNLSALREKVLQAGIGRPGDQILASTPATSTRSQVLAKTDIAALTQLTKALETPREATTPPATASPTKPLAHTDAEKKQTTAPTPATQFYQSETLPLMRTFKQDVQQTVRHNQTSVVDMISANERQRAVGDVVIRRARTDTWLTPGVMIMLGISLTLIIGAALVGMILFLPKDKEQRQSGFFTPDETIDYDVTDRKRANHVEELLRIRDGIEIKDDHVAHISMTEHVILPISGETEVVPLTTDALLRQWEIVVPDSLDRSLGDRFMFGFVGHGTNEPFLIIETNYTDGAFAGMLDWEQHMSADLDPLFPTDKYGATQTQSATTTLFGSDSVTTTGPVGLSMFEDTTVANLPARALRAPEKGTVLLWSMSDNHIIVSTNEEAARRVVDRLQARTF